VLVKQQIQSHKFDFFFFKFFKSGDRIMHLGIVSGVFKNAKLKDENILIATKDHY
jgi:hypothetical protein